VLHIRKMLDDGASASLPALRSDRRVRRFMQDAISMSTEGLSSPAYRAALRRPVGTT